MTDLIVKDRDELIKKLAWEVAKNVLDHHKNVYSSIFAAAPSTFPISLRNGIYNEISSAIKCHTDEQIEQWIARSAGHRKQMQKLKRLQQKARDARGNKTKINEVLKDLARND